MPEQSLVRLYADSAGESHFEDVDVTFDQHLVAPPAEPLPMSVLGSATAVAVLAADAAWDGGALHPSPARQLLVCTSGGYDIVASDGESRHFARGDILLLEDTTGRGHRTLLQSESSGLLVRLE